MSAAQPVIPISCENLTLLELVQTVCEVTGNDREVVATVRHMLLSGSVKLSGNFRGQPELLFR